MQVGQVCRYEGRTNQRGLIDGVEIFHCSAVQPIASRRCERLGACRIAVEVLVGCEIQLKFC